MSPERRAMTTSFDPVAWTLAHGRTLTLGPVGLLMAIINVTPDSFSDGGRSLSTSDAVENAMHAIGEGACIACHHRRARRHRFERGEAEALVP